MPGRRARTDAKRRALAFIERMARLIGAGEMAHDQREIELRHQRLVARAAASSAAAREAEPVDAGIDMEGAGQGVGHRRCRRPPIRALPRW